MLFLLSMLVVASAHTEAEYQRLFSDFVVQHSKNYATAQFFERYNIFKANVDAIQEMNTRGNSFTVGMNQFTDLTTEEWSALHLGYKHQDRSYLRSKNTANHSHVVAADALDWVDRGAVTGVKNQGQCGSCWSFSTTGSVEGANFIANKKLISLSEQQLVDCAGAQGNMGCNGGLMDDAFQYIIQNGGITTEEDYPYTGRDGTCDEKKASNVAVTISSFVDVKEGDESDLLKAVNVGPVSVAIEADQFAFQFYSGGVMDGKCGTKLDHGVLLVGYGTDGLDYWKVKNSWGASWGEEGYIRMTRGKNQCGIALAASYPVV